MVEVSDKTLLAVETVTHSERVLTQTLLEHLIGLSPVQNIVVCSLQSSGILAHLPDEQSIGFVDGQSLNSFDLHLSSVSTQVKSLHLYEVSIGQGFKTLHMLMSPTQV